MNVQRKPPAVRMTVAEFTAWDSRDRSGRLWQLRDGIPEAMAPASDAHGAIQGELGALIRNHLLAAGRPCRLLVNPGVTPRVRARDNVRIPDLAVTCALPGGGKAAPEPVLLIEILSPSNASETWNHPERDRNPGHRQRGDPCRGPSPRPRRPMARAAGTAGRRRGAGVAKHRVEPAAGAGLPDGVAGLARMH
jgi:hypothetical protein